MSVIYIKDLVVQAKHGLHQHEKIRAQRFKISIELTVDNGKAGITDNIEDTLSWSELRNNIVTTVENNSFNLVERLAQVIAQQILHDRRVLKAIVSIDKLDAFENGVPGIRLEASN
jgi:7,8-dihydroneopterin aldolase/epimerase/oxygenase